MDITTISRVILTAEDKTGPAFDSAQTRAKKTGDVYDQLTKLYGAEAAAAIKAGMDAERAFSGQLAAMQRARAEISNMQRTLDQLGAGNRDIARAILGTRSSYEISNEIKLINSALESLKHSANVGPAELARASAAAREKVAALRAEMEGVAAPAKGVENAFSGASAALLRYASAAAVLAAGFKLSKEFIETADGLKLLQARLAVVTGSAAEGKVAFAGLVEDARRLRVPIEDAAGGFVRIAASVRELGGTTAEARKLNEILLTTAKVSGIAGDEAANAARQFAQALGSGVLQGDELRSILENNQELARQLAAGLGVSIGELRKLGSEGKLTADVVANALLSRLPEIQAKMRDVPLTTAEAFTALRNEMTLFVADADNATGASTRFAASLKGIASFIQLARESGGIGGFFKAIEGVDVSKKGWAAVTDRVNDLQQARVNLRAIENEMDADAQKSAFGVAAAAKRAYDDALKVGADFLTKQQKITAEFGASMKTIATAIDTQQKVIATSPAGSAERIAATEKLTQLEKLRAAGMADVVKKIAEADAADAKRGRTTEKLTALDQLWINDMQVIADLMSDASEHGAAYDKVLASLNRRYLDGSITVDQYVDAEERLFRTKSNVQKEFEKAYAEEAKAREASLVAYDKSIDAIDSETERVRAQTAALGLSKEALQAREVAILDNTIALKEQTLAELQARDETSASIAMIQREIEALKGLASARDQLGAAAGADGRRKDQLEADKKAATDLYNFIDDAATSTWGAITEKGENAWKKITETFKSTLLAAIYKLTVQPIVFNLVASITGIAAPGSGVAGAAGSVASSAGGLSSLLGGNGLSGIGSLFGGISNTIGNLSFAVADFSQMVSSGVGIMQAFSTATTAAGIGLAQIVPVVGAIAAVGYLAYQIFNKPGGGPKDGGNATIGNITGITGTDSSGTRYFTPNQQDAELQATLEGVSKGYADIIKALGLKGGDAGFALGFDTDPKGTAPNRIHAGTFVNGTQVYDAALGDLGRDDKVLQERLALEAKRILFAAIQSSLGDAPEYMQKLFSGIDAATATASQIDEILSLAQALKLIVDTMGKMGDRFAALDVDQMRSLVEAFGGLENFLAGAQFLNANFTTAAEQRLKAEENVTKAFKEAGYELPKTHAEFLALTESLDLTTEEGRKTYATLVQLAPAFVALNGTAEEAAQRVAEMTKQIHEFNRANLITDAERQVTDAAELAASFAELGAAVPATHADFLQLIGTLGLTQEEALALSELYVRVNGTAQEAADAEKALADARRDALASAEEIYRSKFFTGPEQAATRIAAAWVKVHQAWTEMGSQLLALGLDHIPTTNAAFRDLVESIDRTTPEGQALYEALILLSPTIADLNESIGDLEGTASASAEEMQKLRDNILEFLDSLKIGDLSPLTPEQKLMEAQSQYLELLQKAQGGDADALAKLPQVAQDYLTLARDFYASSQQYTDIFNSVVSALEAIAMPAAVEPAKTDFGPLNAVLPTGKKLVSDQDLKEGLDKLADRFVDGLRALAKETVASNEQGSRRVASTVEESSRRPRTPR